MERLTHHSRPGRYEVVTVSGAKHQILIRAGHPAQMRRTPTRPGTSTFAWADLSGAVVEAELWAFTFTEGFPGTLLLWDPAPGDPSPVAQLLRRTTRVLHIHPHPHGAAS